MRKVCMFLSLAIFTLLISCSKSTTEPETDQIYRLSKMSDPLGGWEWNLNYDALGRYQYPLSSGTEIIYNDDNLPIKKIDVEDQDSTIYVYSGTFLIQKTESDPEYSSSDFFEYTNDLLIRHTHQFDEFQSIYEYSYNNSGRIIQVLGGENSEDFDFKQVYNYNGDILINSVIFWFQNDEWVEVINETYEFENDLLLSVQSIWNIEITNGDEGFLQTFQYDENGNCISRTCYYSEDGVLSDVPDWINEYQYELVEDQNSAFDYFDFIRIEEAGQIFISPIYFE
ncbi:MAG: hypothetical protein H8E57_10625 [Candidatus Cloacimonetes bacterium]|nr:hypothetical protein [Candidatus Cloacimonadota bacterium]